MSIIDTLITDRTQADVNRVLTLSAKGWAAMTAAEKEEFEAGMKGAYKATDLNRVNAAMEYLDTRLKAMGYTGGYYQRVKVPHKQSGGGSVLPEGYTQVAYIQSGGTQYVDTGFKPNQDTRVVMDFELLSINGQYADPIFGVRTSATANAYYLWCPGTASSNERYQSGYNNGSTYPAVTRVGRHTVDKNKNVTTVDGVTTEAAYAAFTTAWNMLLFQSYNNGNLYSQTTKMRLYSCQTYDNDALIRDYIPCETPDGEVGLYDLVTREFYGNAGTGAFIAGPEVEAPDTPDEPGGELDPYTWYVSDIPTPEALEAYLDNVRRFRSAKPLFATTPQVPEDIVLATIEEWNDIEQILVDIETSLTSIAKAAIYAGTPYIFAGGPMIYATGG